MMLTLRKGPSSLFAIYLSVTAIFIGMTLHPTYAANQPELVGAIEVGSSGIKAAAWQFIRSADGNSGLEDLGSIPPRNVSAINESATEDVANAVSQMILDLNSQFKVPSDKIYIYASSGVGNLKHKPQIEYAILMKTKMNIDVISPITEAKLIFNGTVIYKERRPFVVSIDIGSGNVKIAHSDQRGPIEDIATIELPFGVKTFAKKIDEERGDRSFVETAARLKESYLVPQIRDAISRRPGLQNLNRIYLAGGIVFATSTLVRPDGSLPSQTDFNPYHQRIYASDFDKLYKKATTDPDHLFDVDLRGIGNSAYRDKIEQNINNIRTNIYTANQLIAGLEIMRAICDEMEYRKNNKTIFFSKDALNALIKGYVIEKIGE
ncbi:hypothetical protein [Azospirillum lipoferum]|uniref:Ppx/GppA phosphatase domain-containing protein n=1 Tax=Azospirillum lipoferum (strain 4B) TaxID=862719 RepID=G7ZGE1_AZOL4|nr:hypothetical protein [Azospirillum lipoferum]CBS90925.1 exported protein of unknown function; putative Actin-like ATPase domain [Azospirillum lipoferum 4B]